MSTLIDLVLRYTGRKRSIPAGGQWFITMTHSEKMLQRKQSDTQEKKNPVARSCLNHTVDDSGEACILTLKEGDKKKQIHRDHMLCREEVWRFFFLEIGQTGFFALPSRFFMIFLLEIGR